MPSRRPRQPVDLDARIDAFVDGFEAATGHDGWVAHQLLHHKVSHIGGDLTRWHVDDLAELLLGVFPRSVLVDPEDAGHVAPTARAFVRWLHDAHGVTGDPLPRLLHALDEMTEEVAAAVLDASRFGPAKSIASMMRDTGIDLEDRTAVSAFIDDVNRRPEDERRALIPLPGAHSADHPADPFDDLPPLPPAPRLSAAELAEAAGQAPLLRGVRGFVEGIGDGRPLTKTGNLRLADGLALVEALGLDDVRGRHEVMGAVRSTAELADLDLTFRVARKAGYVRVQHGKVLPTKRAAQLRGDPAGALSRVVVGLLGVGILDHRYRRQQYLVPPWVEYLDDGVLDLLVAMHVAGEPLSIEELGDMTREDLRDIWELPRPTGGDSWWWDVPERDVREVLRRLEEAGVVALAEVQRVPRELGGVDQSGGTVALTPLGATLVVDRARAAGAEVIEAGRLVDADAAALLAALPALDAVVGEAEADIWIEARGATAALAAIAGAAEGVTDHDELRAAASLVLACAEQDDPADVEQLIRPLVDHPVLGPLAGGWLLGHGFDVDRRGTPVDGLASMAILGAPDEAVLALQALGDPARQAAVVEEVRARSRHDAIPFLQAVADLHEHKVVAKAARKALFRLGVRR